MNGILGDIGTIEWSRETKGLLRRSESWRYICAVLLRTMQVTPRLLLARAGVWGSGSDPSLFAPPDTVLTRRVLEACTEIQPMLVEHGIRSYLFARALGRLDALECDDEALFVAAVLHDYAFPVDPTRVTDRCFAYAGAEVAEQLLRESSLTAELQHAIVDSITLHLNPYVSRERGVLQHLLHAGVMADAAGVRAWELDRDGVRRVCAKHPRMEFLNRGLEGFRAHGAQLPASRAQHALWCGFGVALKLGPWAAYEAPQPA